MAFGQFRLSHKERLILAKVLRVLIAMQIVIGLCLLLFCYDASRTVLNVLHYLQRDTFIYMYILILIHAYCIKLHYTVGLRIVSLIVNKAYWSKTRLISSVWMLFGTVISFNGLLIMSVGSDMVEMLVEDVKVSFKLGISRYLSDPFWKRLFDRMQIELSCCGVEGVEDWYRIPWMTMDMFNEDSQTVTKLAGEDGRVVAESVPFSCCAAGAPSPCAPDALTLAPSAPSPLAARRTHVRGCLQAVRTPLHRSMQGLTIFSYVLLVIQLAIVTLTQIVRTSARAAVLAGDPASDGMASLFKEGKTNGNLPNQKDLSSVNLLAEVLLLDNVKHTRRYCENSGNKLFVNKSKL